MKIRKTWKRLLSVLLTVSIVITTIAPSTAVSAAENSSTEISVSTQDDDSTPKTTVSSDDVETSNADKTDDAQDTSKASLEQSQSQQADNDKTEGASTKAATDTNLYQNGSICIYNEQQLKAVGTGTQVYEGDASADTFGTGAVLTDEEGNTLTYAADGSYTLMNDIPLTKESIWTLPEGFTGTFESNETAQDGSTVYDKNTDTIYLYHNYQLQILAADNASEEPVMSGDYAVKTFGSGQMIYLDEEENAYLTYSSDHNYVLVKSFVITDEVPMSASVLSSETTSEETQSTTDGRAFAGQVIWTDTETNQEYILIGNEQQLRAIGSDDPVYTAVYQAKRVQGKWEVDTDESGNLIMLYGGDADLTKEQNGKKDYALGKIDDAAVRREARGVDQKTGEVYLGISTIGNGRDTGHTYSRSENYIIFRDINLSSKNWEPLTFTGTMDGRKGMKTGEPVTLSNITIRQDGELDMSKNIGIGFFATLSSERENYVASKGQVSVSNLILKTVDVQNNSVAVKDTFSLLGSLVEGLGALLGVLLWPILQLVGLDSLSDLLIHLGDIAEADPTNFATGGFAGRIYGQASVNNCIVEDLMISNKKDMTGGFVGSVEGMTQYDALSGLLKGTLTLLEKVLNVIPFLGLGDLITILLNGGLLDAGNLIPIGYYNPEISNCHVKNIKSSTLGSIDTDYNGGFVGRQVGTMITNCSIQQTSDLTIQGDNYVGGFAGLTVNAEIKGLLNELGVNLLDVLINQSAIAGSSVTGPIKVNANTSYSGGFAGAMGNSYAVECTVSKIKEVTAIQDYAGGFTGFASLGWATSLGDSYGSKENNLLNTVKETLGKLLGGDQAKESALLSLVGVSPSVLAGCSVKGDNLQISAKNYAAGLFGKGDGTLVYSSIKENVNKLNPFSKQKISYEVSGESTVVQGISSILANESYAGGVTGYVTTASAAGLLDETLEIGNYLPFQIEDVTVTGVNSGYSVTAKENYAGGGFGYAIGGTIKNVTLSNAGTVTANNYAGGFIGVGGTGDLASASGLNVLGLNLVEIKNLLSVAQGVALTIDNSSVAGIQNGLKISAIGKKEGENSTEKFLASGFIASANSVDISNSHVTNLQSVTANETVGYAGGFIGISRTGGLADVVGEQEDLNVLGIDGLLGAVPYLIPSYTKCTVSYISNGENAQIKAAVAGGFVAELQSGTIDNTDEENDTAVYQLENVNGTYYAGGFAGRALPGGLVKAGGLDLLNGLAGLNITSLKSLLNYYVPIIKNAGVSSVDQGFVVSAANEDQDSVLDAVDNSGSAGGFIGYGSGVQISSCNVNKLKHTTVEAPKDLEAADGSSYFDNNKSSYAITAARYAGGFIGKMDIGSTAAIGSGLKLLQNTQLTDVLSALSVVTSTIEYSHVFGAAGGYAVLANNNAMELRGHAGGYAGSINGGHIQNSHANNFEYVIGQETAGGYVGNMEPGNVASVLGETTVLDGLVLLPKDLLDVAETFVPTIRNSYTTCVPCGGVVRADASSSIIKKSETTDPDKQEENNESESTLLQKGMAGGYVGHSAGGQIWGNNADNWKNAVYTGEQTECAVKRIRSVYGAEYAGGFSGYMECASTASSGSLSLLYGLVKTETLLGLLNAIYPTDENTAVYGPLLELDMTTWNNWVNAVGDAGAYADELKDKGAVTSDDELKELINSYAYGYSVVAGREQTDTISASDGNAGGYTGSMVGGVITNATATGVKKVYAIQGAAGGFAGKMLAGGVASVGETSIAGLLSLNGNLLGALQTFVPVIKESSVEGYQSGAVITATGQSDSDASVGCAGGYVGHMLGGQIQGKIDSESIDPAPGCNITKLRSVEASVAAGGYAGRIDSGAAADVNTNALGGAIGDIINKVIGTSGSIASVLKTIVSTVHYAKVETVDSYGIIVQTTGDQAEAAGGFVGIVQGAVLGSEEEKEGLQAIGIRAVTGAEQAGGFLGIGDVAAVAEVAGGGDTTILGLIEAGAIDVLDAFRPYIYEAKVVGSQDGNGLTVTTTKERSEGSGDSLVYIGGNAGGFGGSFLNGTVTNSTVEDLKSVKAPNYTGGFIGYSGKSGVVDANKVDLGDGLLDLNAGILDVFGSHINYCNVSGLDEGYTVQSTGGHQEIAGGFIGYADLSRMEQDTASNVRQVYSDEIAGGFVGKTSMAYLVSVDANSKLLDPILKVVNGLIKALYLDDPQDANFVELGIPEILEVEVLSDGKILGVTLFGLHITVALSKDDNGETDVAIITIGDSEIKLPCSENGVTNESGAKDEIANAGGLKINLIKANRTKIADSTVIGISVGYDVFGAGASNDKDGKSNEGYTGGFVGYNDAGLLEGNKMEEADTIRGFAGQIGEFSGYTDTNTSYDALEDPMNIEKANTYQVYRTTDKRFTVVKKINTIISQTGIPAEGSDPTGEVTYTIKHLDVVKTHNDWQDVYMTTPKGYAQVPIKVYISDAQADLMYGVETYISTGDETAKPGEMQDPCDKTVNITIQKVWKDNDGKNIQRPTSITVELYRLGQNTEEEKVGGYNITGDASSNVWSVTIPELPAVYEQEDGTYKNYTYTVKEVGSQEEYITEYTKDENGYNYVITNTHTSTLVEGDSVVIDFGLPVKVNVLANDAIQGSGTLTGVSKGVLDNIYKVLDSDVTEELNKDNKDEEGWTKGYFGRATVVDGTITYEPTTMEMDSFDQFTYSVKTATNTVNEANGSDCYIYSTLTVIPATTVYYEDNAGMITYTNGTDGLSQGNGIWLEPTDGTVADNQDTDRPGIAKPTAEKIEDDMDNMYGYDSNYTGADSTSKTKYSNGSSHFVTVGNGNLASRGGTTPTASFTFTGTGFDVIGVTDKDTGTIKVQVEKQNDAGEFVKVKSWIVDTYYGYKVEKNKEGDLVWVPDPSSGEEALYQLPVIRYNAEDDKKDDETDFEAYGRYRVTITPNYSVLFDRNKDKANSYNFYLDAVRIYSPADSDEIQSIKEVYVQDGEYAPEYQEVRDIVIEAGEFEEPSTNVYVDGCPEATWENYRDVGPSHELYLDSNQAIALTLTANEIPESVRIGAKTIQNSVDFTVGYSVKEDEGWVTYGNVSNHCSTATDLYYDITDQCVWEEQEDGTYKTKYPITIKNTSEVSNNILSLTYIKYTTTPKENVLVDVEN